MKLKNIVAKGKIAIFAGALLILASCGNDLKDYWENAIPEETYVTDAAVSSNAIVFGESVTFTDLSTQVYSREWSFPGGNPASSMEPVVDVTYGAGGKYEATLTLYHNDNLKQVISFDIEVEGPVMLAYGGTPAVIPGVVEFENYDIGGEGVSYHDTEAENKADANHSYRADDGIDINAP